MAVRDGWLWSRLRCWLRGHQAPAATGAFGRVLPDGRVQELFYCTACGSPFWQDDNVRNLQSRPP